MATTTTTYDLCAIDQDLCVQRGDTFPWTFTLYDSTGTTKTTIAAGTSYLLTVNTDKDPAPGTELFQVTGVVLTQSGATLGQVQFSFTAGNWTSFDATLTAPAKAYYDLQETTSGGAIRTIAKGDFQVDQDITK